MTRPIYCTLFTLVILRIALPPAIADADEPDICRKRISSIGSERATTGGNKIVTLGDSTYVVWQDAAEDGSYFNRTRAYDRAADRWTETFTLNQGKDNHARPVLTADGRGYLHVILNGHNSAVTWRRSVRPGDPSEWTEPVVVGEGTYAKVVCGPDDTLYLTMRSARRWEGLDFYVKRPGKKWKYRGMLVKKQNRYKFYAAYHNALAWGPDHKTLHMSTGFFMGDATRKGEHNRDPQGLHQAVGYMHSDNFGRTWTKADGTPIKLPATTGTIDLIDEGIRARDATDKPKPGIRHCGLAVDSSNRPYVVYVRHTPKPGHIFLVTPDGAGGWEHRPLQEAVEKHWPGLAAVDCSVSMTCDDVLCLLLTLAPLEHRDANWSPGIYGRPAFWLRDFANIHRIVWLESRDGGRTFKTRHIIDHDPDGGTLLPTLEKPTGFNGVAPGRLPPVLYTEGLSRYREPGEVIQNEVYFVQPQ